MDKSERLSKNFVAGEFLHSKTASDKGIPFPDPPENIAANIRKTAAKVQEAVDILEVDHARIANGWRPDSPVDINALVGGSPTSAHVEGLAADVIFVGKPLAEAMETLSNHPTFMQDIDQLIIERGCLHFGLPCKASNYVARNQLRTEAWILDATTGRAVRKYPLKGIWKRRV